jgi:hypothetical protein
MRTYPLQASGAIHAFEVSNAWLRSRAIARLVRSKGAEITFQRRLFGPGDLHLRFRYKGQEFQVVEPFGDNSRYWVGPVDDTPAAAAATAELHEIFAQHRLGIAGALRSFVGG